MGQRVSATVTIPNRLGLHARPATSFAQLAQVHDAEVIVVGPSGDEVDGKSVMEILMLGATQGARLYIHATGADASAAVAALCRLVEEGFGEE